MSDIECYTNYLYSVSCLRGQITAYRLGYVTDERGTTFDMMITHLLTRQISSTCHERKPRASSY